MGLPLVLSLSTLKLKVSLSDGKLGKLNCTAKRVAPRGLHLNCLLVTLTASKPVNLYPSLASHFHPNCGARCSSVVRAFAHCAMGRRIDPSWGGPIELFLVPASAPRLV